MQPNHEILEAQDKALEKGALTRYNITRFHLKSFTITAGYKSRSIDNAVLGHLPKRLLFTLIKNNDFNSSMDTNPYKFRHYDISEFSQYVNGRRVPSESLPLDMDHEKGLS